MKRKMTIRRLLRESKHLNFIDIPYFKTIVLRLPGSADIAYTDSCEMVLQHLEELGETKFLTTKLEDILVEDEGKSTRCLVRWSFFTGVIGSFAILASVIYLSLVNKEMPDLWLTAILVAIPAGIMWTQAGVLKGDNAEGIGRILGHFGPGVLRKRPSPQYRPQYDYDDFEENLPRHPQRDLDDDLDEDQITRRVRRPRPHQGGRDEL